MRGGAMPGKRIYIAYGSNLNLQQMKHRCPTAKPLGTAVLHNYELLFRGGRRGGVATVEQREGFIVPVLLWDIRPKDEAALDGFEGFPKMYGKQMMEVEFGGRYLAAMVYVMSPGHEAGFPSKEYLNTIAAGYLTAGFNLGILTDAVERTEEVMCREMEKHAAYCAPEEDWEQGNLFEMKWR